MNDCAWCGPASEASHGICDECMHKFFGVDPAEIHAEIAQEDEQQQETVAA
jgi:hypothetical protein